MTQQAATSMLAWLIVAAITVWSYAWVLIALWKAARRDQLGWFIACAIFSFAGIIPMIYVFAVAPRTPELGQEMF